MQIRETFGLFILSLIFISIIFSIGILLANYGDFHTYLALAQQQGNVTGNQTTATTGNQTTATTGNQTTATTVAPPIAYAGGDQTLSEGETVQLNGSASRDLQGGELRFAWNQTAGTPVTLSDASSPTPTFTTPDVGANGDTLTFKLTVNDTNGQTATDTVNVNVSDERASVNPTDLINKLFESRLPELFIIIVFLVIIIPLVLDIFLAYRRKPIEGSTSDRALGMPGLNRSLMTFGIIILLGTVIFYLLALITLNMNNATSPAFVSLVDLLRNLSIILGTALATIIAFYFGIRGSESSVEKAANAMVSGIKSTEAAGVEGPPKVLNTRPADGAKDVPTNTLISATFSEPMSSGTIDSTTYSVREDGGSLINGKISLSPDAKTAEFKPDQLEPNTTYIAEISERVKDLAGNAVGSITRWSFTTAAGGGGTAAGGAMVTPAQPEEDYDEDDEIAPPRASL